MRTMYIILIAIVVVLVLAGVVMLANFMRVKPAGTEQTACEELGCSPGDVYVGSINSDKYYECDCHYAQRILPENIVCFANDDEALADGRVKSEC